MAVRATNWATAAAEFLSHHLPVAADVEGWEDRSLTAYQIGCMALIALGYAEERDWGAIAINPRTCSGVSVRWDDVCVSVLLLAKQQNLLDFRRPVGRAATSAAGNGFRVIQKDAPAPPILNIKASNGLGAAYGKPEVLRVLEHLGLISDDRWVAEAEMLLWRVQPKNWLLNFTEDKRFIDAAAHAAATVPPKIAEEFARLLTITEDQISERIDWHAAEREALRSKFGSNANFGSSPTQEQVKGEIEFSRCNELDWIFYRFWRMDDGWLPNDEVKDRLDVFHDPLAIAMRKAVIQHLFS